MKEEIEAESNTSTVPASVNVSLSIAGGRDKDDEIGNSINQLRDFGEGDKVTRGFDKMSNHYPSARLGISPFLVSLLVFYLY